MIVQKLVDQLPAGYVAEPRVHLGDLYEIDVCAFAEDSPGSFENVPTNGNGLATATWSPPAPSMTIEADFPEQYAYEVLVFDVSRDRELVAAIEIVSPANKDRPDSRQVFVAKCASLLQKGVSVSIVDLVTIKRFNLYADLLALIDQRDPELGPEPPPTYAVTCRKRKVGPKTHLDTWLRTILVGQSLPTLPVWLTETLAVSVDLEASYQETCRVLRIP
jgi:hypothetical protein